MQIIRSLNHVHNSPALPSLALAIGNFDGVHLGHAGIINEVKKIAKEKNIFSAILTFEPHPKAFFQPTRAKDFRINTLSQKLQSFQTLGIDYAIILPFNQDLANIQAGAFIEDVLCKLLNVKHLVVGYDFVFGQNRQGNFDLLETESKRFNFDLTEISALKMSQEIFSSSFIRKLIWEGKMAEASKFLGKDFAVTGLVNQGRKLARQLGFPTANVACKPHIVKPKFGVYKTNIFIPHLQQTLPAITNFGIKPTLQETKAPLYETHIPNFNQDIYGKKVVIECVDFLREERKFDSLDALKAQIAADIANL